MPGLGGPCSRGEGGLLRGVPGGDPPERLLLQAVLPHPTGMHSYLRCLWSSANESPARMLSTCDNFIHNVNPNKVVHTVHDPLFIDLFCELRILVLRLCNAKLKFLHFSRYFGEKSD